MSSWFRHNRHKPHLLVSPCEAPAVSKRSTNLCTELPRDLATSVWMWSSPMGETERNWSDSDSFKQPLWFWNRKQWERALLTWILRNMKHGGTGDNVTIWYNWPVAQTQVHSTHADLVTSLYYTVLQARSASEALRSGWIRLQQLWERKTSNFYKILSVWPFGTWFYFRWVHTLKLGAAPTDRFLWPSYETLSRVSMLSSCQVVKIQFQFNLL